MATSESPLDSAGGSGSKQSVKYSTEEEDWDCVDSASDLEHVAMALEDGSSIVSGKNGHLPFLEPPTM